MAQTILTEPQQTTLELIKRGLRMSFRQMATKLGINDNKYLVI